MKKGIILVLIIAVALIGAGVFFFLSGTPRGKQETERGFVYYFSDGVVGVDTTGDPHEFYIYASHPDNDKIKKAELIEGGIQITGPGLTKEGKEFLGNVAEVSVGYSGPKVPGKFRVTIDHGDWTETRQMAIEPESIQEFVDRGDWGASVRELWEK